MADVVAARWSPVDPWAAAVRPGRRVAAETAEPGVILAPLTQVALATVVARQGMQAELGARIRTCFALDPPPPGKAHFGPAGDLVWSAPGQWLVVAPGTLDDLPAALAGVAAVTAQSDGRALLRVAGRHSRAMLAKGFSIDLHERAFTAGSAAVTSVAHIGVQIWQRDEAPTYIVSVARSFVGSFWAWAVEAAAEYGFAVGAAGQG